MEDNLKALEVLPKLTPEIETKINKIMGTNPDPKINFRSWTPFPSLRLWFLVSIKCDFIEMQSPLKNIFF